MDFLDKASASRKGAKADKLFEEGEYMKALELYLEFLKYKIEGGEPVELGPYYKKIADCYMKMAPDIEKTKEHNLTKAAEYYARAGEKYESKGDYHNAGAVYESVANCYEMAGEHAKASEYDNKSAQMFSSSGEEFQASHSFLESADYAYENRDYKTAAESYIKAAELDQSLNDDTKASDNYEKAGKCMEHLGDCKEAIEIYSLALGLFDKVKAYEKAAAAYESIGRCKEKLKDFESAINNYVKAARTNEYKKNYSGMIANFMSCGRCYESLSKIDDAVSYYLKAAKVGLDSKDMLSQGNALMNAARCLESRGDHTTSVSNYMASGEAYTSAGKRVEAVNAFNAALDISLKEAEKNEKRGDYEAASLNYQNASYCYYNLKDYERAADLYSKHAQAKEKVGKKEEASEAYALAGEAYAKSNLLAKAGDAYMRAGKLEEAASYFLEHAKKVSGERHFFEAGKYYDLASGCYKKIEKEKNERDAMNSSIWQYVAYLDSKKDEEKDNAKEAEANLRIGEGYIKLEDTRKAIKNMLKARELYEKMSDAKMTMVADAQVKLIDGKTSLKAADYAKAYDNLKNALALFDKINLDEFDEFDRIYLRDIRKETEDYVREIESRPDIDVNVEQPGEVLVNSETILRGEIVNNGKQVIERIVILPSFPSTVEVRKASKECLKLEPGEKFRLELKVYPTTTGSFVFKPIEMLYHDAEDKKYMKSSNEITLNVTPERKEAALAAEAKKEEIAEDIRVSDKIMRGFIGTEPNSVILVSYNPEKHNQVITGILGILIKERNEGGVYVSVSKPYTHTLNLMGTKGISSENIKFIDCITRASGSLTEKNEGVTYVESPSSLEEISMYSEKLMKEVPKEKKFLLIDSISSLLIYNDERAIEELVHFLVNQIRSEGVGGVILSADETSTQSIIRRFIPTCDKIIKI